MVAVVPVPEAAQAEAVAAPVAAQSEALAAPVALAAPAVVATPAAPSAVLLPAVRRSRAAESQHLRERELFQLVAGIADQLHSSEYAKDVGYMIRTVFALHSGPPPAEVIPTGRSGATGGDSGSNSSGGSSASGRRGASGSQGGGGAATAAAAALVAAAPAAVVLAAAASSPAPGTQPSLVASPRRPASSVEGAEGPSTPSEAVRPARSRSRGASFLRRISGGASSDVTPDSPTARAGLDDGGTGGVGLPSSPVTPGAGSSIGHWALDEDHPNCGYCAQPFTMMRRRHHCRRCGLIFCARCSSHFAALAALGGAPVRLCRRCYALHSDQFL